MAERYDSDLREPQSEPGCDDQGRQPRDSGDSHRPSSMISHEDTKTRRRVFGISSCLRVFVAISVLTTAGCRRTSVGDAVQEARENAYRSNNLGVALLEQFRYPEAAEAFRQAIALDGSLGMAHLNLALALLYSQDTAAAAREAT